MPNPEQQTLKRVPLKHRLQALLVEYGSIALWVYFIIFAIVLFGFALALRLGVRIHGFAGSAGIWAGAYVAAKLTQPLRILATIALTPVVATVIRRRSTGQRRETGN